jgi:hypothetical protein
LKVTPLSGFTVADRRHLPGVALVGAALPLLAAGLMTANPNCVPGGGTYSGCYAWGYPRVQVWTALAVPAGLLAAGLGALVPERWMCRATGGPVGALLFAPNRATLAALGPVVVGAALLAPPLFYGTLTADATLWLVLAVPYLPFLATTAGLFGAVGALPSTPLNTALTVVVALLTAFAQAAWFAALAAAVARAYETASRRNSGSE